MGCNCKGKNEGADLKFFTSLDSILNQLGNRIPSQIKADFSVSTKAVILDRLITVAAYIDSIKSSTT